MVIFQNADARIITFSQISDRFVKGSPPLVVLHDSFNFQPLAASLTSMGNPYFTVLASSPQEDRYHIWTKEVYVRAITMDPLTRREVEVI